MSKYGIKNHTVGVYKITCKINNKSYIGSSINIITRLSNHMNRETRKYPHHIFYKDVIKYKYNNFTFEVLEECTADKLLEREQYWYDKLKPEYNIIRPNKCSFNDPIVKDMARKNYKLNNANEKLRTLYHTEKYNKIFTDIQAHRMKSVKATSVITKKNKLFKSLSDGARWITETTDYKGVNKVSKIKAVADGERKTAYGYYWEYI